MTANRPAEATPGHIRPIPDFRDHTPGDAYACEFCALNVRCKAHNYLDCFQCDPGYASRKQAHKQLMWDLEASAPSLLAQADAARGLVEAAKTLIAGCHGCADLSEPPDQQCPCDDVYAHAQIRSALASYAAAAPEPAGDAPASTEGQQE